MWVAFAAALVVSSLFTFAVRPGQVLGAISAGDPNFTTVAAPATASVDDGADIVVTSRDENDGLIVDGGRNVTVSSSLLVDPLVVIDNNDGTYTAHLDDINLRTHVITATINGQALTMGTISIVFTPGAPAALAFTPTLASPKTADDTFGTAVTVYDQHGNVAPSPIVSVTLSGAVIGGDVSNDTALGVAQFTGLTVRQVGNYTIEATGSFADGPLDGDTLDITPGVLHHFTFGTVGTQTAGAPFNVVVTAYDAWNNIKTDYAGTPVPTTIMNGSLIGCSGPCGASAGSLGTFVGGVATISGAVGYKAESGRTITVTDGAVDDSVTFTVGPADLAAFKWTSIATPQTANATFSIEAKAYDAYDNLKTNYNSSPTLSTLEASPNETPATFASTMSFASGIGSASGEAFKASAFSAGSYTADQSFTVTDGSVSATSNLFAVQSADLASLRFSSTTASQTAPAFAGGQPIDTKVGAKMYSACTPAAVGSADPCTTASTALKVLATDAYGNRKPGVSVAITRQPVSPTVGIGSLAGTASGTSSAGGSVPLGETWFSDLSNTAISGTQTDRYQLTATSGSIDGISAKYRVVTDLAQCTGQTKCVNTATTPTEQVSFSYSKAQIAYGDVATTTNFSDPTLDVNGQCTAGRTGPTIGSAFDMRIVGNTGTSNPTTTMFTTVKMKTLKALGISARNADAFNVCLGALYLDGPATGTQASATSATKWTGKDKKNKASAAVAAADADGLWRQWAVPADCGQKYLNATYDPCVTLKTKSASAAASRLTTLTGETWTVARVNSELKFFDGDIGIFITKPFPWDGKGGSY